MSLPDQPASPPSPGNATGIDPRISTSPVAMLERPAADPRLQRLLGLYAPAYQIAVRVLGQAGDGEDVVQTAYLKVVGRLPQTLTLDEVQPWFFAVVVNTAREHLRSDARRRQREDQAMPSESATTQPPAIDREMIGALRTAVEKLDAPERLPLILCHEQGLTQAAAAQILGISPRLVSVHLAKALTSLRQSLSRAGFSATPAVILTGLGHTAPAAPGTLAAAVQQISLQAAGASSGAGTAGVAFSGIKSLLPLWAVFASLLLVVTAVVVAGSMYLLAGSIQTPATNESPPDLQNPPAAPPPAAPTLP